MTLKPHRGRCAHCGHDHDAARKMAEYRAAAPVAAEAHKAVAHLTIGREDEDTNSVGWRMTKAGYELEPGEYPLYARPTASTSTAAPAGDVARAAASMDSSDAKEQP